MEPDADQDPEENGGTTRTDGEESTLGMRRRLSLQHEILLLCSSTWFLVFSAMLIPGIVLPLFRETFSMTLTRSGSLMTLFWLTHALVQYPSGFLSDRYGSRLIIGVGLATMACGQFLVATASSFSFLMVSFAMIAQKDERERKSRESIGSIQAAPTKHADGQRNDQGNNAGQRRNC